MRLRLILASAGLLLALSRTAVSAEPASPGPPGGSVYFSSRLANHFLAMPIANEMPIRECILGAMTQGTVVTQGKVSVRSVPQSDQAVLELIMSGVCRCSDSVSHKGPATVYGSSATSLEARTQIFVGPEGMRAGAPVVQCRTNALVHDVQTPPPLERFARRRTMKKLPQVEEEVSRRDEERIAERVSQELAALIAQANETYVGTIRKPLTAAGAWPETRCWSDASGLQLLVLMPGLSDKASSSRPADWKEKADFSLCVHESVLNGILERLVKSVEVTDEQLLRSVEFATGDAPRALWVHARAERWSVVLAAKDPLKVSFRDGAFGVTIALQEVVRGEQRIRCPATVSAQFDTEVMPDGLVLTRRGDVQVQVSEGVLNDEDTQALRAFLSKKAAAVLAESINFDALQAPAGGTIGQRFRQVKMDPPRLEGGWATFKYNLQPDEAKQRAAQAISQTTTPPAAAPPQAASKPVEIKVKAKPINVH